MSPPLFALFLATFAIGTTEFAVVGLLPDIAASLDVSISRAGLLVSGYALGVAVGGPVIVALTSSQPRKRTLLQLCAIFVVGHALAALAPDYGWLMGARVLAAISHASFLGIAAIVAAGSVPPERSARAVSFVWLGFSAASLVGVPSATAIGHALGWRAAFWMLTAVGVVAGAALQLSMPASPRKEASTFRQEVAALRRPHVLLAVAMSLLVCASTFAVFTYVAPLLTEETGISAGALPIMLLLFGVGGAAGMVIGGRLGDWKPLESVAALSLAYAVFYLGLMAVIDSGALVGAAMILWGFLFLAPCVPLQMRVVKKAIDGPNLASTLNQSAFNVGNALGPTLGAIALSRGFDYRALPWIGSVPALTCAATAVFSCALEGAEAVPVESERPRAPPSPSP
jgi:MFS transporter, DHA1 family, inner membrane transport protein